MISMDELTSVSRESVSCNKLIILLVLLNSSFNELTIHLSKSPLDWQETVSKNRANKNMEQFELSFQKFSTMVAAKV